MALGLIENNREATHPDPIFEWVMSRFVSRWRHHHYVRMNHHLSHFIHLATLHL
jgi:hypothetical protein